MTTANLNGLADELDTRLCVGEDRVTDTTNNAAGDPALPTMTDVVVSPEPPRNPGRENGGDNSLGPRNGGSDGGRGRRNDNGRENGRKTAAAPTIAVPVPVKLREQRTDAVPGTD